MNKLLKAFFCLVFLLGVGFETFGQAPVLYPVRRYPSRFQQYPPRPIPYRRTYPNASKPSAPVLRVEHIKENFIGHRLNLSPEQSKSFWPLYREYVQDQTAIKILIRQNSATNSPDGTQQIDRQLDYESQLVEIRRHYRDEFLKVLPPQKVSELYKSERQFNDEAVRILGERGVRAGNW